MKTLILDAVTKSITAVMAGAAATTNPDFTSHYADVTTTAFTEAATDGVFNGTTPVNIVAAPAAATRRVVKCITIQNRDTAAVVITLNYVSAGGTRQLWKGTLAVGDTFTLDGTYDTNGNLKTTIYAAGLVTTQHTHAKLVGSTGAVDPALSADATGSIAVASALTTVGGVHVGGTSDPGTDNLLVDGTAEVTGATTLTGLTKTAGGVHVGGTSDPGADNLLVDGAATVTGNLTASTFLTLSSGGTLTIASGVITVTASYHTVDTEGAAAADDLVTINGGATGRLLILNTLTGTRVVTVKDGTGNIYLAGDFAFTTSISRLTLIALGSNWYELSRSTN